MIWIIGGTCEAVELVERIKGKARYIVSSATESEKEFLGDENLVVSRMDAEGMTLFIKRYSICTAVDLSHPYALEVSRNAKDAAKKCGIEYIRYVRKKTEDTCECINLDSLDECIKFLKTLKGCVFFTTGSKNIKDFEEIRGDRRFVYRILPAAESIEECQKNGVKMKDIIAALGPFSEEYNAEMFKEYGADYVVMKDSGVQGGTQEKINACKSLGIKAVIIGREDEEGLYDLNEVINRVL